jgi:hypothetical protein
MVVRTRCSTDQTLYDVPLLSEGWNFSCKSEKIADIATQLFGAQEIVCGNIEFAAVVMLNLRQNHLYSAAITFAGKTEVQSRSLAKNASESKSSSTSKTKIWTST